MLSTSKTKIEKQNLNYELYSFDIFDTLITKKVATPKGIFALMQDKIQTDNKYSSLSQNIRTNFYILRAETEQYLKNYYRQEKIQEITIEQIYSFWANIYSLSDKERNLLIDLEIKTEQENLIVITKNFEILKELIKNKQRVILISDMYLNSVYLKKILCNIDAIFKDIPLYCSADILKTKQSGDLYDYVKNKENVEYDKWVHYGDNIIADIQIANRKNITTIKVKRAELKEYEKYLLQKDETNIFVQYTIGAAKNTRLFYGDNNQKKELGISLAAPMLFPYISWIVEQSTRQNIKRLYFIARDGYVLKMMTDLLISASNLDLKTYYIYGSREAWRMPSISLDTSSTNIITYIFNEKWFAKSITDLAIRFGMSLDEFNKYIPKKYIKYDKILTDYDLDIIKNSLSENSSFLSLINLNYKEKRENLEQYLKQELDFSDDKFAFVDLQGSGITQKLLASLIQTFYKHPIKCFYSRLSISPQTPNDKYVNIFIEFPNKNFIHFIRELFCRALHGQTIDYKENNGRIEPIFEGDATPLLNWGYADFIEGIRMFTEYYVQNYKNCQISFSDLKLFTNYYYYILNIENTEIAELLGSIPFSYVGKDDDKNECAPKYTMWDFWHPNLRRTIPMYSMLRSSKMMQKIMKFRFKYSNLMEFLFYAHISKKKNIARIRILGIEISFKSLLWRK